MDCLSPVRTTNANAVACRSVLKRGAGPLVWTYIACMCDLFLRLMDPQQGIKAGAILVCVCLAIQVYRNGFRTSGPLLLFAGTMFLFVWGRPFISFSSDIFDLRIIEALTTDISVTEEGLQIYFGALIATMAAFCATILYFQLVARENADSKCSTNIALRSGGRTAWRYLFLCGVVANSIESALYVRYFLSGASYYDLYTQSAGSVGFPGLSLIASFQFYGYLGVLLTYIDDPSSKVTRHRLLWTIAFVLFSLIGLARGSRGEVFTQLLVGLWLYSFTGRKALSKWKWAILGVALFELSQLVGSLRSDDTAATEKLPINMILSWFVYSQGLSGQLVSLAANEFGVNPTNFRFVLSPLAAPVRRVIDPSFGAQTEQKGLSSGSLAHELAFRTSPSAYLAGHGIGSSYIAESYCALGVLGVLLATALLTWIVLHGPERSVRSRSVLFVFSGCLPYVLFTPRESFLFAVVPAIKSAVLLMFCEGVLEFHVRYRRYSNVHACNIAFGNNTNLPPEGS
jgi:hypothetical protein